MKKFFFSFCLSLMFFTQISYANENILNKENAIQTRINNIGINILNSNKITKRIIFTYDKASKKEFRLIDKTLTDRQFIFYDGLYKFIENDDELAGVLAREIVLAQKSYHGLWGGKLDTLQIALSSKKFEIYADMRAVDYMVKAGYNPLGLITFIHKYYPQKKSDFISRHNLTSKRLAKVYEYITIKYPVYIENNLYLNNPNYQNFLLSSLENRKMLEEKLLTNSNEELDYE